jgi:hypothetical protein
LLTLLAAMIVSLGVATAAHAAVPSLLGGEQVDGHNSALNAVSCSSASFCVGGGLDLIVQNHAVRSDLTTQLSSDTLELSAISCAPGTQFCALMDDTGGAYTMSGGTLSPRTAVSAPNAFDAVSCPISTFCMAIDEVGNTFDNTGSGWISKSAVVSIPGGNPRLQVSCASAQFCIATFPGAGNDVDYDTWTGSSWTPSGVLESDGAAISGLSCTPTTFCVATDTQDFALRYNSGGGPWTPTTSPLISGGATSDGFHVSCSGTFCLADSEENGDTFTTPDGSTWTAGTNIRDANGGTGGGGPTSCASPTMCVIVDLSGTGYTYALPDTTTSPALAGSPAVGAAITLTPGTPASPDASVADTFQRCVGATCTTLGGTSYTTTAADVGATFKDSEMSGVGFDLEGPVASNTIGPIAKPSTGGGGGGGGTTTSTPGMATVGGTASSGTNATVTVSCPAGSSESCHVTVDLTVTETFSGKKLIAVTAKKHKTTKRTVIVGTAAATIAAGSHQTITVSLNRAGKKLLGSRHRLKVQLAVVQSGKTLATKKVGFTAPKKKKHRRK